MSDFRSQLRSAAWTGTQKGWKCFVWMCEIIVPISFLVTLLQWSGWLDRMHFLLNPLMGLLSLPAEAALPIISGMLINIYAVIAALAVIPFTVGQMTLIAVFNLIAHNLIMEGVVQFRSRINVVKATVIRIAAATLTVLIVSRFLGDTSQSVALPAQLTVHIPLIGIMKARALDTGTLLVKVLGIIMFIMVLLETSRSLGWIDRLLALFEPVMRVFGLSSRAAVMFVAGNVFGLMYGGAVIVEEGKKGTLTREEIERLHISLGINHSMVEDPALFAMLGVNLFWLWVPRLIIAVAAVHAYRLVSHLRSRRTFSTPGN